MVIGAGMLKNLIRTHLLVATLATEFRPTHPRDARLAPDVDSSLLVELPPHDVRVVQLGILPVESTHLPGLRHVLLLYI